MILCPKCHKSGGRGWVRRYFDRLGPLEHADCASAFTDPREVLLFALTRIEDERAFVPDRTEVVAYIKGVLARMGEHERADIDPRGDRPAVP